MHIPKLIGILAFILALGPVEACVIGPQEIGAETLDGFEVQSETSELCEHCSYISVRAPSEYKERPFSHVILTVFLDGVIISRAAQNYKTGEPQFSGIISADKGITYDLEFYYGHHRCMSYKAVYRGQALN